VNHLLKSVKQSKSGFTIVEIMVVLAIGALILLMIFIIVPSVQRTSQNDQKRQDIGIIQAALTQYLNSQVSTASQGVLPGAGCVPSACNCGVVWEYDGYNGPGSAYDSSYSPATAQTACPTGYAFISGLLHKLSFYKNIDEFLYARDSPGNYTGSPVCINIPSLPCGSGNNARTLSSLFYNTGGGVDANEEVFIDSSSVCTGQYGYPNDVGDSEDDEDIVIIYQLTTNNQFECVSVLANS
jgi:prepilin-type N-terminal cleavage/methylation domain-containing protein